MKRLLPLLFLALATSLAHANSAGNYQGGVRVETGIHPDNGALYVKITDQDTGATSGWQATNADPSGDGFDVLTGGPWGVGSGTYRFNDGKLELRNQNGQWYRVPRSKLKDRGTVEHARPGLPPPHAWSGPGSNITSLPGGPIVL